MTLIAAPKSHVKPTQWNFNPALVEPRWRSMLQGCVSLIPLWEGGGDRARDLIDPKRDARFEGAGGSDVPEWDVERLGLHASMENTPSSGGPELSFAESKTIDFAADDPYTTLLVVRPSVIPNGNPGIFRSGASSDGNYFWLTDSSGQVWGRHNGTTSPSAGSAGTLSVGSLHVMLRTWDGTTIRHYLDGVETFSGSVSGGTAWGIHQIGWQFSSGEGVRGDWYLWGAWKRALTLSEAQALSADPFGPFRPARRRRVFVAAAGGLDNARLADLAFCRGRMRFGPGRLPVPDGTIG